MQKACRNCGKPFEPAQPWYMFCSPQCKRESEQGGSSPPGTRPAAARPSSRQERRPSRPQSSSTSAQLPAECVFESFYDGDQIRRGIYLEAAQKVTEICTREGLTATQLRQLFFMLKSVEQRLKAEPNMDFGQVRETVWRFARQVRYQVGRGVLKSPTFAELVERHVDIASKDAREFRGFVKYITSIVAYLKPK